MIRKYKIYLADALNNKAKDEQFCIISNINEIFKDLPKYLLTKKKRLSKAGVKKFIIKYGNNITINNTDNTQDIEKVQCVLVIDCSASTNRISHKIESCVNILRNILMKKNIDITIINFSDRSNINIIDNNIATYKHIPKGYTALNSAIYKAMKFITNKGIVIFFTDGEENDSLLTIEELSKFITKEDNIVIGGIGSHSHVFNDYCKSINIKNILLLNDFSEKTIEELFNKITDSLIINSDKIEKGELIENIQLFA